MMTIFNILVAIKFYFHMVQDSIFSLLRIYNWVRLHKDKMAKIS